MLDEKDKKRGLNIWEKIAVVIIVILIIIIILLIFNQNIKEYYEILKNLYEGNNL